MTDRIRIIPQASVMAGVAVIVGCASTPQAAADPETRIEPGQQGRIVYTGPITSAANERVFDLYDESVEKPDVLFISSGGGSVEAALDLAEWVLLHEMQVEVGTVCFSSCANYVFLAGRTKRLARESMLGWHGSA
ncbi:MAG: hypothetical protein WD942_11605 [Dehalococcoidia bacterium]